MALFLFGAVFAVLILLAAIFAGVHLLKPARFALRATLTRWLTLDIEVWNHKDAP